MQIHRYHVAMKKLQKSKTILIWSAGISALVIIGSLLGLFDPSIYGKETLNWTLQARGQDIGNLFTVLVLMISAYLYDKGSRRAGLTWIGSIFYLIYAYFVYCVALHFNALFLVYVAILGLSLYALLFAIGDVRSKFEKFPKIPSRKFAGYTLITIGVLFAGLWLSEIIPALISGTIPKSVTEAGLWMNPVHVIDLSTVLPGFIITGYLALKRKSTGLFYVAPWLVFSVLMGASIVAAMILMQIEEFPNTIPPMVMVSGVVLFSLIAAIKYLRQIK